MDNVCGKYYYLFSSLKRVRTLNSVYYRFNFNGQEKTDEISGSGNHNTAEFWEYDTRLARRWNLEPLIKKYPDFSSYLIFANNPIRFADPNGEEIIVPNIADRAPILKMINSKALGLYAFNKNGQLYKVREAGDDNHYSKYYSQRLDAAIKDNDIIKIKIGQSYDDNGVMKDVDKDAGGGVTQSSIFKGTKKLAGPVEITISGNENKNIKDVDGNKLEDKPADILIHELVGHGIPKIAGSDTGNAVENENKVRKEVKSKGQTSSSPLRKAEPSHKE